MEQVKGIVVMEKLLPVFIAHSSAEALKAKATLEKGMNVPSSQGGQRNTECFHSCRLVLQE